MLRIVLEVRGHHFVDQEFVRGKRTRRPVLLRDVTGESFVRPLSIVLAAARADPKRSVSDLPDVAARISAETQVETWGLCSTGHRHFSNISAIALSETRNLPATSVTDKRPFLISVRSDRTVTCLPGKKVRWLPAT